MKYKIGEKVRYDGGDWWFYGTVNAVFEHSISPCYRINVDRMEKKSCKLSITQFEFELEAYSDDAENDKDKRKWEASEVEYLKKYNSVLTIEDLSKALKRSAQAIEDKLQQIKPEAASAVKVLDSATDKLQVKSKAVEPAPAKKRGRKKSQKPELTPETGAVTEAVEQKPKRKRGEAWFVNFENYKKGVKGNVISTWIAQNRREYKLGKLAEKKFEKLVEINFPFDPIKKKKTIAGTSD